MIYTTSISDLHCLLYKKADEAAISYILQEGEVYVSHNKKLWYGYNKAAIEIELLSRNIKGNIVSRKFDIEPKIIEGHYSPTECSDNIITYEF